MREDDVLRRADHNPTTQGCLDQGLGRTGVAAILDACRKGEIQALLLQGPELLRLLEAATALAKVPFVGVMTTHEEVGLDLAHAVLPAAMWVEYEGSFTNYERRVQRFRRAYDPIGDARARWELATGLLRRLGHPIAVSSARELFGLLATETRDYAGLDFKKLGSMGAALSGAEPSATEAQGPESTPWLPESSPSTATRSRVSSRSSTGCGSRSITSWRRSSCAGRRTIEFPEKKRNVSTRYRGIHVLTEREDGTPKCVACYMCATVCPAECIYIEAGERPEKSIEKYPRRASRCIKPMPPQASPRDRRATS